MNIKPEPCITLEARGGVSQKDGALVPDTFINTLVDWFVIDSGIAIAHPPDERFNYLWN